MVNLGWLRTVWCWLRPVDREQRYLAGARDLAELERRQRILERGAGGPPFVTFNL